MNMEVPLKSWPPSLPASVSPADGVVTDRPVRPPLPPAHTCSLDGLCAEDPMLNKPQTTTIVGRQPDKQLPASLGEPDYPSTLAL